MRRQDTREERAIARGPALDRIDLLDAEALAAERLAEALERLAAVRAGQTRGFDVRTGGRPRLRVIRGEDGAA